MDSSLQVTVRPTVGSRFHGQFDIVRLSFYVRCEHDAEVVNAYHRYLDEHGLEELEVVDAGVFDPADIWDDKLRTEVLNELAAQGRYGVISAAPPEEAARFLGA